MMGMVHEDVGAGTRREVGPDELIHVVSAQGIPPLGDGDAVMTGTRVFKSILDVKLGQEPPVGELVVQDDGVAVIRRRAGARETGRGKDGT